MRNRCRPKTAEALTWLREIFQKPLNVEQLATTAGMRTSKTIEAVFDEPMDRQMLIHTLGVLARARGMMKLAKETGITRAGLYKALSAQGNPSFETVAKIVGAFGMRLSAQTA